MKPLQIHVRVHCEKCERYTEATARLQLWLGETTEGHTTLFGLEGGWRDIQFPLDPRGNPTGWTYGADGARCPGCGETKSI